MLLQLCSSKSITFNEFPFSCMYTDFWISMWVTIKNLKREKKHIDRYILLKSTYVQLNCILQWGQPAASEAFLKNIFVWMNHFKIQQSVEVDRGFSYEILHNLMNIKIIWQELFCWALQSLSQDQINTFSVKEQNLLKQPDFYFFFVRKCYF